MIKKLELVIIAIIIIINNKVMTLNSLTLVKAVGVGFNN